MTFTELLTVLEKAPTAELKPGGSLGPPIWGSNEYVHRGHCVLVGWAQAVACGL